MRNATATCVDPAIEEWMQWLSAGLAEPNVLKLEESRDAALDAVFRSFNPINQVARFLNLEQIGASLGSDMGLNTAESMALNAPTKYVT